MNDFEQFLLDNKGCPSTPAATKQLLVKLIELLGNQEPVSGGTQLYKHHIITSTISFDIISTISEPITTINISQPLFTSFISARAMDNSNILAFFADIENNYQESVFIVHTSSGYSKASILDKYPVGTFTSDTVTPL